MKTVYLATEKQAQFAARALNKYNCYATYAGNRLDYHANSLQALKLYNNLPQTIKDFIKYL